MKNAASFTYHLARAKSMLKDAGVSGLVMDIWLIANFNPLLETFIQVYAADLASLGVTLSVHAVAAAQWVDTVNNVKYNGMYASPDSNSNVAPSSLLNISPAWRMFPNNSGFNDDQWKQLINTVNTEIDPTTQTSNFSQLNDFILDQSFVVPISNQLVTWETVSTFHGMSPTLHGGGFLLIDAWFEA